MAGLSNFLKGSAALIIFCIALFTFMLTFLNHNNPTHPIITDPYVNTSITNIKSAGNTLTSVGNTVQDLLQNGQPSVQYVFLIFSAAFYIPLAFLGFLIQSSAAIVTFVFSTIFTSGQGSGSSASFGILFNILSALITIGIVIAIVRAVRTGETER